MKLRWLWRLCPCRECGLRRYPAPDDDGLHISLAHRLEMEMLRKDIQETTGYIPNTRMQIPLSGLTPPPDDFAERKSYAYGVFDPGLGVGTGNREDLLDIITN